MGFWRLAWLLCRNVTEIWICPFSELGDRIWLGDDGGGKVFIQHTRRVKLLKDISLELDVDQA